MPKFSVFDPSMKWCVAFFIGVAHGASGIELALCTLIREDTKEKFEKEMLAVLQ